MTRYIEFYTKGLVTGSPILACGNDGIAYLDARLSLENQKAYARKIAKERKFIAFRIMHYPILPQRPITDIIAVH